MAKHIKDTEFEEEVLSIDRVTRVVAGGRRLRFRAVVIVGDKKGRVGLGTGKANDVISAVTKAKEKARKSLIRVPIHNDTLPHDIQIKYKGSRIRFLPAGPGTGVIAGSVMRKILGIAGYKNVLSKSFGTSNKLVNAQATLRALTELQELPHEMKKERKGTEKKTEDKTETKKQPVKKAEKATTGKAEPKKADAKSEKKAEPKTAKKKTEAKKS